MCGRALLIPVTVAVQVLIPLRILQQCKTVTVLQILSLGKRLQPVLRHFRQSISFSQLPFL